VDRPYLTTKQAATALGLDPAYVRRLAKSLGFGWRVERDYLYTPAEVDAMRVRPDRRRRGPGP